MNTKIIAGKSILENTATNTIFIADKLTEETQCAGENRNHIQKVGDLDVKVKVKVNDIDKIIEIVKDSAHWIHPDGNLVDVKLDGLKSNLSEKLY